jgi:hypothetical protein
MPRNYRLELEFFIRTFQTNSGVFIRFRNPESTGDYNPAWSAVFSGFEVQIDNTGAPDGLAKHRTGAVYAVNYPGDPARTLRCHQRRRAISSIHRMLGCLRGISIGSRCKATRSTLT